MCVRSWSVILDVTVHGYMQEQLGRMNCTLRVYAPCCNSSLGYGSGQECDNTSREVQCVAGANCVDSTCVCNTEITTVVGVMCGRNHTHTRTRAHTHTHTHTHTHWLIDWCLLFNEFVLDSLCRVTYDVCWFLQDKCYINKCLQR